jgi:hypothetical protein
VEKWADYGLSKVQYDAEGKRITQVEVRQDKGNSLGMPESWSREQLISAISDGKTFVTILPGSAGNFRRGKDVHSPTVGGSIFVRTDRHRRASDVLKDLPEPS